MERITRMRVAVLLAFFCFVLAFFALKLYDLQIVKPDGDTDNVKKYFTVTRVKAARGDITDRNGNVLVTNRATYDLVFNHFVITSAENNNGHLLRLVELCRELELDYIDHFPISTTVPFTYTLSDYSSAWQGYFQAYLPEVAGGLDSDITAPLLIRSLREHYDIPETWSDEDARAVIGLRYELKLRQGGITNLPNYVFMEDVPSTALAEILELGVPGLKTEESMVRVYNTEYGAHILGYIGAVTKEQWENIYKDKEGYEMDALVGQSGFEEAFEEYLHGIDGYRVDVTTADGTLLDQYYLTDEDGNEQRPVSGKNVELTIDLNLQTTAEEQMQALIEALRATEDTTPDDNKIPDGSDIEGGAVVVMDVKTGKVLACASYPTYNLSTFREDWDELQEAPYAPLFNRALMATYAPGSTYKMSMVVAGINNGLISRTENIRDYGEYTVYSDFQPECLSWSKYGTTHGHVDSSYALCVSCNYYFYVLSERFGKENWSLVDDTAKALGLGEATGVELYEKLGYRANAATKALLHTGQGESGFYPADWLMASIGQSDNRFTPMQLCVYTSTLANRGTRYKATFLNQVMSSDYSTLEYVNQPQILSQFYISDEAYAAYTQGMRDVVLEGTAKKILGDYPIAVAAKTGTAETDSGGSDNGAFVCYAPYDDPQVAIVVYGEKAGHGSTMGQIAKALLDTYFDAEITGDVITGENAVS